MSRNLGPLTAEPRVYESAPSQPLSWHTQKFRYSLRTVMPQSMIGANMMMLKDIKKELLPLANNKLGGRWRQPQRLTHRPREGQVYFKAEHQEQESSYDDKSRHPHTHVRPPSAYSATIKLRRGPASWMHNNELDMPRLHILMRNNTFTPGNFSTLNRNSRQRVIAMVDRLYYDPYERREQNALSCNPDEDEGRTYTLEEVQAIVERLAKLKEYPKEELQSQRKPAGELTAREKEIVDRLTRKLEPTKSGKEQNYEKTDQGEEKKAGEGDKESEEQKDKDPSDDQKNAKTVAKARLDEIIARLTKYDPEKCPADSPAPKKQEFKEDPKMKVTAVEMEAILSRLMTFDSAKWPPESRPEIYKIHTNHD